MADVEKIGDGVGHPSTVAGVPRSTDTRAAADPEGATMTTRPNVKGFFDTCLFTGHDYPPDGREPLWESTVTEPKRSNAQFAGKDEAAFVAFRDKTLPMPKLILHALPVNFRGDRLPNPEANGRRHMEIPLGALTGAAWE
jgi:hypothetical protein